MLDSKRMLNNQKHIGQDPHQVFFSDRALLDESPKASPSQRVVEVNIPDFSSRGHGVLISVSTAAIY